MKKAKKARNVVEVCILDNGMEVVVGGKVSAIVV